MSSLFPIKCIRRVPYAGYVTDVATSTGYFDLCGLTSHNSDFTHVILERPAWCVLRQWVSEDFQRIEQEVYNGDDTYPLPRAQRTLVQETRVEDSSSIIGFVYQPTTRSLEVSFRDGARYLYSHVPSEVAAAFRSAKSKGQFLHREIKPLFEVSRLDKPFAGTNGSRSVVTDR